MPLLLSIKDYSVRSGLAVSTVRKLIAQRCFPACKLGGKYMLNAEACDAYLVKLTEPQIPIRPEPRPSSLPVKEYIRMRSTKILGGVDNDSHQE